MNVIVGDETGLLKLTDMGRRSYRFVLSQPRFYMCLICVSGYNDCVSSIPWLIQGLKANLLSCLLHTLFTHTVHRGSKLAKLQ